MDNSTSIDNVGKQCGIRDMPVEVIDIIKGYMNPSDAYLVYIALEDKNWLYVQKWSNGFMTLYDDHREWKALKLCNIDDLQFLMKSKVIPSSFCFYSTYIPLYIKYSNVDICEYVLDKFKINACLHQKDDIEDGFRECETFVYWVTIVCVEKNASILKWLMNKYPLKTHFHEDLIYGIVSYLQVLIKFDEGFEIMMKYVYSGVPCPRFWKKPEFRGWKSSYAKWKIGGCGR
jgi:hypothetical protein